MDNAKSKKKDKKYIYTVTKNRIKDYKFRFEYFFTCLRVGICPVCGKDLYLKEIPMTATGKMAIIVCPNNCTLTDPSGDSSYSNPGKNIYKSCINYEIRNHHKKNLCGWG